MTPYDLLPLIANPLTWLITIVLILLLTAAFR